jgi:hypothetical protein
MIQQPPPETAGSAAAAISRIRNSSRRRLLLSRPVLLALLLLTMVTMNSFLWQRRPSTTVTINNSFLWRRPSTTTSTLSQHQQQSDDHNDGADQHNNNNDNTRTDGGTTTITQPPPADSQYETANADVTPIMTTRRRRGRSSSSFVRYELMRNNTFRNMYNPYMQCIPSRHVPLSSTLLPLLDFTVRVSTNLKILFLGDSVSVMTAQMFQEQCAVSGMTTTTTTNDGLPPPPQDRTVLRYSWGTTEGLHVAAPVAGGGVVAGWRITGLMVPRGRTDAPFRNVPGGAWTESDVPLLLSHQYKKYNHATTLYYEDDDVDNVVVDDETHSNNDIVNTNDGNSNRTSAAPPTNITRTTTTTIGAFDTLVLRIPHGWMSLSQITYDALLESIRTAHENFGVTTVIIMTLPFINNVQTKEDWHHLRQINDMIRNLTTITATGDTNDDQPEYNSNSNNNTLTKGVHTIITLDFARLADDLIRHQAVHVFGYNYNDTAMASGDYLLDHRCCPVGRLMRSIPLVCGESVTPDLNIINNSTNQQQQPPPQQCIGNSITMDGMHWCHEHLNGRLGAGLACLLRCVYEDGDDDDNGQDDPGPHDAIALGLCAQSCNDRFMSLGGRLTLDDDFFATDQPRRRHRPWRS